MDLIFIPARKGNGKNLWNLSGRPLVDYVLSTAWAYKELSDPGELHVVVSTNCPEVGHHADHYFGFHHNRPAELAQDDTLIQDVLHHYLTEVVTGPERYNSVVLMQPTSPFIALGDLDRVFNALIEDQWVSAQTIIKTPHNFHWLNARSVPHTDDDCMFRFPEERHGLTNKQSKYPVYAFGNLVGVNRQAFVETKNFWMRPSCPLEIPQPQGARCRHL